MRNEHNNRDEQNQKTEGTKDKGNPTNMGSHQEGQYDKSDDDATIRPSKDEENATLPDE